MLHILQDAAITSTFLMAVCDCYITDATLYSLVCHCFLNGVPQRPFFSIHTARRGSELQYKKLLNLHFKPRPDLHNTLKIR